MKKQKRNERLEWARTISISEAKKDIYEREKERRQTQQKPIEKLNSRIDELVKNGKSSGAIEQIIKKEFQELAAKLEGHQIPLFNGTTTNRLKAQINDRVEKFRTRLDNDER